MSAANRGPPTSSVAGSLKKYLWAKLGTSSISGQSIDANPPYRQDRTCSLHSHTDGNEIQSIKTKGAKQKMSSGLLDPVGARLHDETPSELHLRTVIQALHEQGIRASDIRCIYCHARLIDIAHITMTPRGPIGPECIGRSTGGDTILPSEA